MKTRIFSLLAISCMMSPALADEIGHGDSFNSNGAPADENPAPAEQSLWEQLAEWFELSGRDD